MKDKVIAKKFEIIRLSSKEWAWLILLKKFSVNEFILQLPNYKLEIYI